MYWSKSNARHIAAALGLGLAALVTGAALPAQAQAQGVATAAQLSFPEQTPQGSAVIGRVPPGSQVSYRDRVLRTTSYGTVVFGIGRTETEPAVLHIRTPDGLQTTATVRVVQRQWPTQHVNGVPRHTASPSGATAERIQREQARVNAARQRDDDRADFAQRFIWPVKGRISSPFGHMRVYNGIPSGTAHSGIDIAAPTGTPVKAPAGGIVTFADQNLFLTGGTILVDHGFGISSNFLHLSRIDVKVGQRIEQGQVIGAVGSTGRSSGPHLHWGMNWFDVRFDPLTMLERP